MADATAGLEEAGAGAAAIADDLDAGAARVEALLRKAAVADFHARRADGEVERVRAGLVWAVCDFWVGGCVGEWVGGWVGGCGTNSAAAGARGDRCGAG